MSGQKLRRKHRVHFGLRWLYAICLGLCASAALATPAPFDFGERYFESVSDVDDIPYGMVTRMAQDKSGLLWIGTQNGLLRFDGYRFRRFVHEPGNPASMSGDFVQALAIGNDGRIWVGTEADGISVLDPASERFTRFRHDPVQEGGIGPGTIHALAVASDGGIWIAADVGLVRHDPGSGTFTPWIAPGSALVPAARDRVHSLLFDRKNNLWIGTRDGLARLRPGGDRIEMFATQGGDALSGREVSTLFEDDRGALWIGTREHGAARLEPDSGDILWIGGEHASASALGRAWVNAIAQPSADEIWLSRFSLGVVIVDRNSGAVRHLLQHDPGVPSGIGFDAIGCFLVDRAGLLWVGTWGGGLQRHNPRNQAIHLMRHSPTQPHRLTHPSVLRLLERDDGRILAGSTGNGIDIIDRNTGVIGGYRPDPARADALADGTISGLAQASDGTLWVGTYQAGVHRLDAGAQGFRRYTREHGLPTLQIEYLYIAMDGGLWVGTGDGLVRYDAAADRFVELRDRDGRAMRMRVNQIAQEADGRMWVATSSGLLVIEAGATHVRALAHDEKDTASLASDHVTSVLVDRKGRLWADTAKGLDRYHRDADGHEWFEHVSTALGIPGVGFGGNMLEDETGRIWTPLYLFDPEAMTAYALHRADGFDIGAQWNGSSAATRDGHLLFGGSGGLAIVTPARFVPWQNDPRVVISGISVDGRELPLGVAHDGLTLAPGQLRFGIEFSAIDYAAPQSNRFEYRLLGFAEDWVEVDADHRHAGFSNLWPGEYTLELRARNRVGDASKEATRLAIRVLPAYWQTPWFAMLLLALLVALVYLLMRLFAARYRRRAIALQVLVDERTHALREAVARAETASRTDPLSGLGNRRSLHEAMPGLIAANLHRRNRQRAGDSAQRLALMIVDIDNFKAINDRHGHRTGDRVIEGVGARISASLREGDIAVRWGGEEFLLVVHAESEDQAWQSAERLRRDVAAEPLLVDGETRVTQSISIGVGCLPFDPTQPEALGWEQVVEIADAAMYIAKHEGRNRVCAFRATGPLPANFIERFRRDPEAAAEVLPVALVRVAQD